MRGIFLALPLIVLLTPHESRAVSGQNLPDSVQAFYIALDTLLKADERPEGITPEANVARIRPLMEQVVDGGTKANRAELNSLYPQLGDHFLDDAVAHAQYVIQVIDGKDPDAMTRAIAAIVRWKKWWKPILPATRRKQCNCLVL